MLKHFLFFAVLFIYNTLVSSNDDKISANFTKIWGPGLQPHLITMPARYFFIQAYSDNDLIITRDLGASAVFDVVIEGVSELYPNRPCRVWKNVLNRRDGSYIVRYKVYETCDNFKISVHYEGEQVAKSSYNIIGYKVYPDQCNCSIYNTIQDFLTTWQCGDVPSQIISDLKQFPSINLDEIRKSVIARFDQPHSVSLCHYVIKNNQVNRQCYGKYVGFKTFMDSILLSLTRKLRVPDMEFFVNLGDWPLSKHVDKIKYPIWSWCGSTDSNDIVMPTYDITESTLENMGRVMLDILSVQGNTPATWDDRLAQAFWRGRDSNQRRLDLIDISRTRPDLFNVSLTNFFFFRDKQEQYGPKTDHVSFYDFFKYKYQVSLDGTVAAYRFPYLLAGGSLVLKQSSKYYEHFYNKLNNGVHFVEIKEDLSDLIDKIKWAMENESQAKTIAQNGQLFANAHLLPKDIFCYHVHLINEYTQRVISPVEVFDTMEVVTDKSSECICHKNAIKDEL